MELAVVRNINIVICFSRCIVTCVTVIVLPVPLNRLPMAQSWKQGVLWNAHSCVWWDTFIWILFHQSSPKFLLLLLPVAISDIWHCHYKQAGCPSACHEGIPAYNTQHMTHPECQIPACSSAWQNLSAISVHAKAHGKTRNVTCLRTTHSTWHFLSGASLHITNGTWHSMSAAFLLTTNSTWQSLNSAFAYGYT
jgi:hypothetical protein